MPDDKSVDEDKVIGEIIERLQAKFPDATPETVAVAVAQAREAFGSAKVRDFVPVLVEKDAKARLKGKR